MATALATLLSLPAVSLAVEPSAVHPLARLAHALGPGCPKLWIKRDDLLSFGFGGNKVRKLQTILASAQAQGADTLITCGAVQSNHARVTAAAGAALGKRVVLVLNGAAPPRPTGNLLLSQLFGAEVRYVRSRSERAPEMEAVAADLRTEGRRPFVVPLGASTALGAAGFARGVGEVLTAGVKPDLIVHATSSGGTQAALIAGCALFGLRARVLGVSADDAAGSISTIVLSLLHELAALLGGSPASLGAAAPPDVDDRFVGDGYGISTDASAEATELLARTEGIVLDPVYTAKAMAALIARIRRGEIDPDHTVLFWHTGGVAAIFA